MSCMKLQQQLKAWENKYYFGEKNKGHQGKWSITPKLLVINITSSLTLNITRIEKVRHTQNFNIAKGIKSINDKSPGPSFSMSLVCMRTALSWIIWVYLTETRAFISTLFSKYEINSSKYTNTSDNKRWTYWHINQGYL